MPESRKPHCRFEREFAGIVVGIDEVGRGPLAGPVVAAAVVLPRRIPRILTREVDDSKKLSQADRERLDLEIRGCAVVGVGEASVEEIDRLNILQAAFLAMRRAVAELAVVPDLALVDGNAHPGLPMPCQMVIGGDGIHLSIAAASIVAKVVRDRHMITLADLHPEYGWHTNVGYGTQTHRDALKKYGPTPHHRTSFAPVRECILTSL
ncbi:MAG TPA: ribonuclease HII [Alphaproteobacteria bacterium]|jgi:ribonuclease HII|nr:ribonuclease HII [Alphaproteobacteria bacterium]